MKKVFYLLLFISLSFNHVIGQKGDTWNKKYYAVMGNWSVKTENGDNYLILHSNFKTSKGPDLKVFLSKQESGAIDKKEAIEKSGFLLGDLQSIKGEQKYLIPNSVKISDFKSIVIHCQKYTKVWGSAPL
jgi:hypothetical protein